MAFPYGIYAQAFCRIHMVLDDDVGVNTFFLADVCTKRAVGHFVSRWRGFVRRRLMRLAVYKALSRTVTPHPAGLIARFA